MGVDQRRRRRGRCSGSRRRARNAQRSFHHGDLDAARSSPSSRRGCRPYVLDVQSGPLPRLVDKRCERSCCRAAVIVLHESDWRRFRSGPVARPSTQRCHDRIEQTLREGRARSADGSPSDDRRLCVLGSPAPSMASARVTQGPSECVAYMTHDRGHWRIALAAGDGDRGRLRGGRVRSRDVRKRLRSRRCEALESAGRSDV